MKENTTTITDLLPEAIKVALSEESLSVINNEFEKLVESKVNERINIATAAAEAALDEEVNKRCTELVHKIEEAHKIGLERVYTYLTEKNQKNERLIRNFYKQQLNKEAECFRKRLCENVARAIDERIDKFIPYAEVKKAVKNDTAMRVLESFKGILNVNEATVKAEIREAVLDGESMLKEANEKVSSLSAKNTSLQNQINEMAESYAFERNISQLDEDTKNFVIRFAKKAGVGYANENMEYLRNLHAKKVISERKEIAANEMNRQKRTNLHNVNRRVLAEKATAPKKSLLAEDRDLSNLIDAIESDLQD